MESGEVAEERANGSGEARPGEAEGDDAAGERVAGDARPVGAPGPFPRQQGGGGSGVGGELGSEGEERFSVARVDVEVGRGE